MKLSRKLNILKKLYFFGHIGREDLDTADAHMVDEVKTEMKEEREKNNKKVHDIQINDILSKNNISPGEEK